MGYRAANAYDEDAARAYRAAWARLPLRTRVLLRLRQVVITVAMLGFGVLLLAGMFGLL